MLTHRFHTLSNVVIVVMQNVESRDIEMSVVEDGDRKSGVEIMWDFFDCEQTHRL